MSPSVREIYCPDDARRRLYADFALESGVQPPAMTSVSQILAWPLWIQDKGAILLANYTGEPATEVRVRFETPVPISKAHALHGGDLPVHRLDAEHAEVTLPMADVTDIIQLQ